VILARGIDLSVAAMLALCSMFLGEALVSGWPGVPAVIAIIAAGLGLGLVNGLLIGKVGINFFVVTLGTSIVFRSGSLLITNGDTITLFGVQGFDVAGWLGDTNVGPVPIPAIVAAFVFALSYVVLRWSVFGRSIYAIGGNPEAARLSGIDVRKVTLGVYAILGLLTAVAGLLLAARVNGVTPGSQGNLLELDAVTEVVIGGTSLLGGRGSITGTVLGTLVFATLANGMNHLRIDSNWQLICTGTILLAAVLIDVLSKGKRS